MHLQAWGPLLNTAANPGATLVTLFMNWPAAVPDLEPACELPLGALPLLPPAVLGSGVCADSRM